MLRMSIKMIIVIGFIESIFIFLIGVLIGVVLSYQLFQLELAEQLLKWDMEDMRDEIQRIGGKLNE